MQTNNTHLVEHTCLIFFFSVVIHFLHSIPLFHYHAKLHFIQPSYNLPFTWIENPLVISRNDNALNFFSTSFLLCLLCFQNTHIQCLLDLRSNRSYETIFSKPSEHLK
uniref:Uncharacterized protein n=1 Tax=Octopus bimaculoides TaxID=37653 RepID=A0A0L8HPU1_OCTBM